MEMPCDEPASVTSMPKATMASSVQFDMMTPKHYKIWLKNYQELVDNFKSCLHPVLIKLVEHNIITKDDKDDCTKDGARHLVDMLFNRGDQVLVRIIDALSDCKLCVVSEKLMADLASPEEKSRLMRGNMKHAHKQIITSNYTYIVDNLTNGVINISARFFMEEIIDQNDFSQIKNAQAGPYPSMPADTLVNIFLSRGENVLPRVIGALHRGGYEEMARKLDAGLSPDFALQYEDSSMKVQPTDVMNPKYDVIQRNYTSIIATIESKDVLPLLHQAGVIDRDHMDEIQKADAKSRKHGVETMLAIISRLPGDDVVAQFVECVGLSGYDDLNKQLKP